MGVVTPMTLYVLRRILGFLVTLLIAAAVIFILLDLLDIMWNPTLELKKFRGYKTLSVERVWDLVPFMDERTRNSESLVKHS